MENPYAKMLRLVILSPIGIVGAGFLALGAAGIFLYGILIAYRPSLIYQWQSWAYPLIFLALSAVFIYMSLYFLRKNSFKFLEDIRNGEIELRKEIMKMDSESSEFGPSSKDMEILRMIRDSGGYVPVLRQQIIDSPFTIGDSVKSIAKLSLLGYVRVPYGMDLKAPISPTWDTISDVPKNKGMKIILTSKGLDAMSLSPITFVSLVPWDISIRIIHANILYREGNHEKAILEVYNLLERAFKVHLIPTIDNYREKWNENVAKKVGNNEKELKLYSWNGERTITSLNALWNFYKKNVNLGRKWSELGDMEIKQIEKEKARLKDEIKMADKIVDVVADTRSRYAHNKPGGKYKKDAYRLIKLAEILIGLLFEDMKEKSFGN